MAPAAPPPPLRLCDLSADLLGIVAQLLLYDPLLPAADLVHLALVCTCFRDAARPLLSSVRVGLRSTLQLGHLRGQFNYRMRLELRLLTFPCTCLDWFLRMAKELGWIDVLPKRKLAKYHALAMLLTKRQYRWSTYLHYARETRPTHLYYWDVERQIEPLRPIIPECNLLRLLGTHYACTHSPAEWWYTHLRMPLPLLDVSDHEWCINIPGLVASYMIVELLPHPFHGADQQPPQQVFVLTPASGASADDALPNYDEQAQHAFDDDENVRDYITFDTNDDAPSDDDDRAVVLMQHSRRVLDGLL